MTDIAEPDYNHVMIERIARSCGLDSSRSICLMFQHLVDNVSKSLVKKDAISLELAVTGIRDMLCEISPKGPIETMLALQMIGTHFTALRLMPNSDSIHFSDSGSKSAQLSIKFLKAFTEQLNTLKQYRLKGRQEIRVEHISVNGGQNILGPVKTGEG